MRVSARTMAIIYFVIGTIFIYAAVRFAEETMWNFFTIIFALIATLDFGAGFRYLRLHNKIKKIKKG